MEYKALYRKFRPLVFDDVIGQGAVIETLVNQINSGNVSHAYLFTGSRGTGKTTTSKIISRSVNCEKRQNANPCNQCATCQSILNDANMDVFEMDAASNNGVDDIREIREMIKFAPSSTKYKVMIIDEVHMLSKGAFNALLKTLEEPPHYMIFILATTEPHKVPATITSRCQRFEFKRIPAEKIAKDLQKKCDALNVKVSDDAINLIVRLAEGAMRDALSLLEQCLSFSGETLDYQTTSRILGRIEDDAMTFLATKIIERDSATIVEVLRQHYQNGKDVQVLLHDLINLFKEGMRYSVAEKSSSIHLSSHETIWLDKMVKAINLSDWLAILDQLLEIDKKIQNANHPWVVLELALLKIASQPKKIDFKALEMRVERLEKGIEPMVETPLNLVESKPIQKESQKLTTEDMENTDKTVDKKTNSIDNVDNSDVDVKIKPTGETLTLDVIKKYWDDYLICIKEQLVTTFALMKEVKPIQFDNGMLTMQINEQFAILRTAIENENNMNNILSSFKKVYGQEIKVNIIDYDVVDDREKKIKDYFDEVVENDKIIIK